MAGGNPKESGWQNAAKIDNPNLKSLLSSVPRSCARIAQVRDFLKKYSNLLEHKNGRIIA
jgi:hypothetical protein